MVVVLNTELQVLVERPLLVLPTANQNYVGSFAPPKLPAIWKAENGGYTRLGVVTINYSQIPEGESLAAILRRSVASRPDENGFEVEVLNLPPGRYFPRMARPHHQHPEDTPTPFDGGVAHAHEMAATNLQLAMLADRMWRCFQVVDPAEANLGAYGGEFRSILILAATEVEAQCKGILKANHYLGGSRLTTRDYVKLEPALRLADYSIGFPEYPWLQSVAPFGGWSVDAPTESLPWYAAYNAVKHDRETNFPAATLKNALEALAAVVVIAVAQFGTPFMREARIWGQLFSCTRRPKWTIGDSHGSFSDHGIDDAPIDYPFC